jgi:hypothetical protein
VLLAKGRVLSSELQVSECASLWNSSTAVSLMVAPALPDRKSALTALCNSIEADVSGFLVFTFILLFATQLKQM